MRLPIKIFYPLLRYLNFGIITQKTLNTRSLSVSTITTPVNSWIPKILAPNKFINHKNSLSTISKSITRRIKQMLLWIPCLTLFTNSQMKKYLNSQKYLDSALFISFTDKSQPGKTKSLRSYNHLIFFLPNFYLQDSPSPLAVPVLE